MTERGWTCLDLQENEALARVPFSEGSPKNWFVGKNTSFFASYLCVLLQCDDFFRGGLQHVHHGQLDSYYKAILAVAQQRQQDKVHDLFEIKPFQGAAMYRAMIKFQTLDPPMPGRANQPAVLMVPDSDEEQYGLQMLDDRPQQAQQVAGDEGGRGGDAVATLRPLPGPRLVPGTRAPPKPKSAAAKPQPKAQVSRRGGQHEKSFTFGKFAFSYYTYGQVPSWRAHCPYHDNCSKSMRVNQEKSEDASRTNKKRLKRIQSTF